MNRPGKPHGPHYLSHQTLDTDHGIILDVTITSGDVHDAVPYLEQIERVHKDVLPVQGAAADSAYDFSLAHRVLDDHGISFFVRPRERASSNAAKMSRDAFTYDAENDVYICSNKKQLRISSLHREASGLSWLYSPDKRECLSCPLREQCMQSNNRVTMIGCSYFHPSVQKHYSKLDDPDYKDALRKRQIWCEGTFAAQKRGHNLTRILRRGLEAAEDHCLLSAIAINLKRMIKATV